MKRIILALIILFVLVGCTNIAEATISPTTVVPSPNVTHVVPTVISTPEPELVIIDDSYAGYWLKLSKQINSHDGQSLQLIYQEGLNTEVVAEFCVRDGNAKTINGFYFLAADRKAVYSTAPGGFESTVFPHNFIYKFKKYSNYYIHPAPWNTKGENGCPYNAGGGCINMRWEDFDIFHNGGSYTNPFTSETDNLPKAKVGTPFVILENNKSCSLLEECMDFYECSDLHKCFVKYTCEFCENPEKNWLEMNSPNPIDSIFQDDF